MKNITAFLLDGELNDYKDCIEFKPFNSDTIIEDIERADSKYITFIKDVNELADNYFTKLIKVSESEFDCCFINYNLEIDGKIVSCEELEEPEIQKKPYIGDYIWCYLWKKEKFLELYHSLEKTRDVVDEIFVYANYIREPLIHHIPGKKLVSNFLYVDEKEEVRCKNVLYLGSYCNGQFNGYITWLNNLGRCFGSDYKLTILYDKIYEPTKKAFERYFDVIERRDDTNYLCDRLLVTYSTYYYDKNIITMGENYMLIHGNMSDYPHSRKYQYDNYTKYIGVSEISAKKAIGYFPTDNISHILNPIKLDMKEVNPVLKLVSAQRNDPIKKVERLHKISEILDEENIPYVWQVFIDVNPYDDAVYGGLCYRRSVQNPLPFINEADYYVQLSDSEACSYSVMEALSLNTKVIVTPLECYEEMNVDDSQGFIIPFELFEPKYKEKLREIVREIYIRKDDEMHNKLNPELYEGYKDLFIK